MTLSKRKKFFDSISHDWDREHNNPEEQKRTRTFTRYFKLKSGNHVLDVGCGTGRLIPYLREKIGPAGRLVELDFSREMLTYGKTRNLFREVNFIQADAHILPLQKCRFDVVICMAFFPHLSDKSVALNGFHKIMKPGAKLYIAHQMNREELNRFHEEVKGPVTNDLLPDDERMKKLLMNAGFKDIAIVEEPGLYLASAIS